MCCLVPASSTRNVEKAANSYPSHRDVTGKVAYNRSNGSLGAIDLPAHE